MTLNELAYAILEQFRSNNLSDDNELDLRLVKDWCKLKRTTYLKNKINSGYNININNTQLVTFTVAEVDSIATPAAYPFSDTSTQKYTVFKSTSTIPRILESKSGPIVFEFGNSDINKYGYQFVPYEYLKFCGNGKFNSGLVFGALRDGYIYLQQRTGDTFLTNNPNGIIRAVFEDPTDVSGYSDETTEFPCSLDIIESIKNSVYDTEFKIFMSSPEDTENSANDEQ